VTVIETHRLGITCGEVSNLGLYLCVCRESSDTSNCQSCQTVKVIHTRPLVPFNGNVAAAPTLRGPFGPFRGLI
jgi:hypothetical protein